MYDDSVFLRKLLAKIIDEDIAKEQNTDMFVNAVKSGNTKLFHDIISEAVKLDDSWILTIESALFSIEQIVKNPSKFIVDENTVVKVELAKKFNAKSIQYLSSHSQDVLSVTKDNVVPSKVMTTQMQEDYCIYENRFVFTLINKLKDFVDSRYVDIKGKITANKISNIRMENNFKIGSADITYNMSLSVKDAAKDDVQLEKNYELVEKIRNIRKRIQIIKRSEFYEKLKGTKEVHSPIMKTNLITKNIAYSNAYKLWLYISSYTFIGFSVEVERKNLPYDNDYYEDLSTITALTLRTMVVNDKIRKNIFNLIPMMTFKEKNYKVSTRYDYNPSFTDKDKSVGEDVVNQYYFEEMKKLIGKTTKTLKGNTLIREKDINISFAKFYRAMTKISNSIYSDVLAMPKPTKSKRKLTQMQKKEAEIKYQKEVYRRSRILSKLKAEELTATLKAESKELVKLERLKFDLELIKDKKVNKKEAKAKEKKKLERLKKKSETPRSNASEYLESLMVAESNRRNEILENKRAKLETQKEARERKLLAKLKEKYEGESEKE